MKKAKVRIKDLPLSSRPREKIFDKGRENLTDAELIALLLGTGSAKQNALVLSASLLREFPLQKLSTLPLGDLIRVPGIGKSKATRIVAALEIGERIYGSRSFSKVVIRTAEEVLSQVRDIIDKKQEHLVVLYLNARHELIQKEVVGMGSLNNILITPKEIFSPALLTPCASIIVVHNHPSGDPTPSNDDIRFTTKVHEAGGVIGIPMLDHLIVSKSGYFSFRENKVGNKY